MMDFLSDQLGRILLVLALLWSGAAAVLNAPLKSEFPDEKKVADVAGVQVDLNLQELATASPEIHFPDRSAKEYKGLERFVFVPEKKVVEFVPVELDIPQAATSRPPQILPSPGPALEGTTKLPRWGEELPPVVIQAPDPKK